MKFSEFGIDQGKATDGVWHDIDETTAVKVARLGNKKFQRRAEALRKPYQFQIDNKTIDDGLLEKITTQAIAETIVVDWKGFEDEDGNAVPYSPEAAFEYLMKYEEFKRHVLNWATNTATYKDKQAEDDEKN